MLICKSLFVYRLSVSVCTHCPLCSFVDRDMLVRHFGHGVGHLKHERQQEPASEIDATGVPRGDDNHDDDDSSGTEESEEEGDAEEPEPGSEGVPVINNDGSSDDESEIEDSDNDNNDSEGDDGGYASL